MKIHTWHVKWVSILCSMGTSFDQHNCPTPGVYTAECRLCVQEKYHLKLPQYPGTSQCVKISSSPGSAPGSTAGSSDPSQIRLNYDLAEKGGGLLEEHVDPDPMKQFTKWFQVSIYTQQSPLSKSSECCSLEPLLGKDVWLVVTCVPRLHEQVAIYSDQGSSGTSPAIAFSFLLAAAACG